MNKLKDREDSGNGKKKRYIALSGQLAWEETTDLSKTDYMMTISIHFLPPPLATGYVQSIDLTTLLNCTNHEVRGYIYCPP